MDQPAARFALIQESAADPKNKLTISELCEVLGVSRSGYYNWLKSADARKAREEQDKADFQLILAAYKKGGRKKGARQIYMVLQHEGITMNLKKIRRLMAAFNLHCPIRGANPYRRMAKAMKTDAVSDNLVERKFEAYGPRMILLTDITYIPYQGKFAYLSTIIDAYTRQILAWQVSDNLKVDFVLQTVDQLFKEHGSELKTDVILHSDQGCHYTSVKFRELLTKRDLRQSMSRRGNCWDNAPQESFFGHMKNEIKEHLTEGRTFEQIKALLDEQINYYNEDRYQWHLAKLSPNEYYEYCTTGIYPIEQQQGN